MIFCGRYLFLKIGTFYQAETDLNHGGQRLSGISYQYFFLSIVGVDRIIGF